jgi:transposase InsO family protein
MACHDPAETLTEWRRPEPRTGPPPLCVRCARTRSDASIERNEVISDAAAGYSAGVLNGLDQVWVADITYLHLAEEFGYLAVILDAFSRKVVGWALEAHLRAELAHFGADHGDHGKATETRCSDPSFRSRRPICLQRIYGNPGST